MTHPRLELTLAGAFLLGACAAPQTDTETPAPPSNPAAIPVYDAKAFHENTRVFGASFSHDESRLLVTMDETGVLNVYSQPVAGGEPVMLTQSTDDAHLGLSYFPADDRFLYAVDHGGNELDHVYVMEEDGSSRDLTPGDKLKALFYGWSGDKAHFYIATNERDPQAFDLYRYRTSDYARELIFENQDGYTLNEVSPDGRWLALNKIISNADTDLYLQDLSASGSTPALITTAPGEATYSAQAFSHDSTRLYYVTNAHGEFAQAWSYEMASKSHRAEVVADWDVNYVTLSESGRYRVSGINEDARTVLRVHDAKAGADVALPDLPSGEIVNVAFSPSDAKMAFYVSNPRAPSNLYVLDTATGAHTQLIDSLNPAIDPAHMVEGEVIRYKSFDGLEIPAIQYRPVQASASNKVPALVWVHGGPGGQSRVGYSALIQHLVNQGYAVLAVNNRGSSGYGKSFFHLDDRQHGEDDLKDCVWARRYLDGLDWVDGERVGIIGGSYGGFMVLAALAFAPEAFDVGVDIFGVSNWLRTLESIPPWWGSFRAALYAEMGDPAQDRERLQRISPLFHAANIQKPLLVIQGANDPRVLQVESDEIVAAVKKNGVPVEYVVFPDEGHGFDKRQNRVTASETFIRFLDVHLRARPASATP
ncbi:alpha/beta fold hydrolase [Haliangium sp.]|uniref:S9 family peptidase n=1 Tax=Haliangium sp. TaxID=2663208 RepID=UPI003D09B9C0